MVYLYLFFTVYFIDYAIIAVPFFLPFIPLCSAPHLPPASPPHPRLSSCPWVVHMNVLRLLHFLYILNFPLSILCLPIMLLIPCTFSLILPLSHPADNLPCDLHFCDCVPILVVCLAYFCFCFFRFSC